MSTQQFNYRLLSKQGVENLRKYKYEGVDHSYYYKYFASPLAQRMTDLFVPSWVAPNLITLLAFSGNLIVHTLIWAMIPTLKEDYPRWLPYFASVSMIYYQTLDNMDGKQARKTGTSSPLGQLFDHGCDNISVFIFALNVSAFVGLTPFYVGLVFCTIITGFYTTLWEEFHTRRFHLPVINGPNEGILFIALINLVCGFAGRGVFTESVQLYLIIAFEVTFVHTLWGQVSRTSQAIQEKRYRKFDAASPHRNVRRSLIPLLHLPSSVSPCNNRFASSTC